MLNNNTTLSKYSESNIEVMLNWVIKGYNFYNTTFMSNTSRFNKAIIIFVAKHRWF